MTTERHPTTFDNTSSLSFRAPGHRAAASARVVCRGSFINPDG